MRAIFKWIDENYEIVLGTEVMEGLFLRSREKRETLRERLGNCVTSVWRGQRDRVGDVVGGVVFQTVGHFGEVISAAGPSGRLNQRNNRSFGFNEDSVEIGEQVSGEKLRLTGHRRGLLAVHRHSWLSDCLPQLLAPSNFRRPCSEMPRAEFRGGAMVPCCS